MPFIIEKVEEKFVDAVTAPDNWIRRNPNYAHIFDANADLRRSHVEAGTTIRTPDWKHVASYRSTMGDVANLMHDGGLIKDKKAFYAWLDRNPHLCTYDRRRGRLK